MKKILLFLSFLISVASFAQTHPGYSPKVNSYGNNYLRGAFDSALHIPNKPCNCLLDRDTTPQMYVFMDSLRLFWNGNYYNFGKGNGGGGGGGSYISLSDVAITSIANGNLMQWNSATGKWNNFTPAFGDVTSWLGYTPVAPTDLIFSPGLRIMSNPATGAFTTQAEILHSPVNYATTGPLPACTYGNGLAGVGATLIATSNAALPSQDGQGITVGDRILVKDQVTQFQNGIYTVTQVGSGSFPFILTRGSYSSIAVNMQAGSMVYVQTGTVNGTKLFAQTTIGAITLGTTSLIYGVANQGGNLDATLALGGRVSVNRTSEFGNNAWTLDSITGFYLGYNNASIVTQTVSGPTFVLGQGMTISSASTYNSFLFGSGHSITGTGDFYNALFGAINTVSGSGVGYNLINGLLNTVSGSNGTKNIISGDHNTVGSANNAVFGSTNTVSGSTSPYNFISGYTNNNGGFSSTFVSGENNYANFNYSVNLGHWNDTSGHKWFFSIGNGGSSGSRHNAAAIDTGGYYFGGGLSNAAGYRFIMPLETANDTVATRAFARANGGGGSGISSVIWPLKFATGVLSMDSTHQSLFRGGIWASQGPAGANGVDTLRLGKTPFDYDVHLSGSNLYNFYVDSASVYFTATRYKTGTENSDTTNFKPAVLGSDGQLHKTWWGSLGSAGGAGLVIGNPITGGHFTGILYENVTGKLGVDSANFSYDSANKTAIIGTMKINGSASSPVLSAVGSNAVLFGPSGVGTTNDGQGTFGLPSARFARMWTYGFGPFYRAQTSAYTITGTDYTIDNTSGANTHTLPTAVGAKGQLYTIKNTSTSLVTINTTSSQTIDGATTYLLTNQYDFVTVQSNDANWIVVARSAAPKNTITTQASTYTITANDYTVIATGTTATWTFPTASTGRHLNLVNHGSGAITLGTAVTTANGTTSTTLAAGSTYQIENDGTVWRKVN